jgi:hypothetical protein
MKTYSIIFIILLFLLSGCNILNKQAKHTKDIDKIRFGDDCQGSFYNK